MFVQIQELAAYTITILLSGLAVYKLFGPSYPWEVIQTEQYLSELVENATHGIQKTQQTEIPIPDIVLVFPELGSTFEAKSGSVLDMSSLESIDFNLLLKNRTCQVIELRTQLKTLQLIFQQYVSRENNSTHKGKIIVSVGNNIIKSIIVCNFVVSCVCEPVIAQTVIEDMTDISVSVRGAEDDPEVTNRITNWVTNHLIGNIKPIIETSIEDSLIRFTVVRHLQCI